MDKTKIKSRFKAAKALKQPFEEEISIAYRYSKPAKDPKAVRGSTIIRDHLFDNTTDDALNTVVNHTLMMALPEDAHWMSLKASESWKAQGNPTGALNVELDEQTQVFFDEIADSNLRLVTADALRDWYTAGFACVSVELTDYGVRYTAIPTGQISYMENGDTSVDTVFREHCLPARSIVERFTKKGTLPDWLTKLADEKPDTMVDCVEAMVPLSRQRFEYGFFLTKDWSKVFEQKTTFQPFIVFRYERAAGSPYCDSLVRSALPQIYVVNKIAEEMLTYAAFAAKAAYLTNDESLSDLRIEAGVMVYTSRPDDVKQLQPAGNFQIMPQMLSAAQTLLKQQLMADILPPPQSSPEMSATESSIRQNQFLRKISAAALRFEQEYLRPLVINTIRALQAGRLMKPFAINGNPVCVTTNSLVKRVEAARRIEDALQVFGAAAQLGEPGIMHVDVPKLGRWILETGGFPPGLLKPLEQVERELAASDAVQAGSGVMNVMKGQGGDQEGNRATGQAVARIIGRAA